MRWNRYEVSLASPIIIIIIIIISCGRVRAAAPDGAKVCNDGYRLVKSSSSSSSSKTYFEWPKQQKLLQGPLYLNMSRCTAADVSPAHAAVVSLVRYANRPFGHQRRCPKRPTVDQGRTLSLRLLSVDVGARPGRWARPATSSLSEKWTSAPDQRRRHPARSPPPRVFRSMPLLVTSVCTNNKHVVHLAPHPHLNICPPHRTQPKL